MRQLQGKRALVTGAASGIGRACAQALADAGAQVVVADIDTERGHAVAAALGGRYVSCDVSSLEANQAMFDESGPVDFVVLNAGVETGCGVGEDFSVEAYRRAFGVNLDGVVFGIHAAIPALKERGGGSIVAIASLSGLEPDPWDPLYGANKHAVVGLARSLAPSLAPDGIRFNAVCPGYVESELISEIRDEVAELGYEVMDPSRVADAALTLLGGDASGECWIVQDRLPAARFEFAAVPRYVP